MVWYVRLLSPPKLSLKPHSTGPTRYNSNGYRKVMLRVTCPINLTTDLSDALYHLPATLQVQPYEACNDGRDYELAPAQTLPWKPGAHVAKADLEFPLLSHAQDIVCEVEGAASIVKKILLRVSVVANDQRKQHGQSTPEPEATDDGLSVPEFLDVWTAPYFLRMEKSVMKFELRDGFWLQRRLPFTGFWEPVYKYEVSGDGTDEEESVVTAEVESYRMQDPQPELRLWEDAGESMARHVWDGGLGLATYLARILQQKDPSKHVLPKLISRASIGAMHHPDGPAKLNILELGAGVGTSGLALAHFLPSFTVQIVLTDLPDAQAILESNIATYTLDGRTPTHTHATVHQAALDWEAVSANPAAEMDRLSAIVEEDSDALVFSWEKSEDAKKRTSNGSGRGRGRGRGGKSVRGSKAASSVTLTEARSPWDLILVSDCTYNSDTLQLLFSTLVAVTGKKTSNGAAATSRHNASTNTMQATGETSEQPLLVLARKPRHDSEEAFFDMMRTHGFEAIQRDRVRLPDSSKRDLGLEEEGVDIFVYR